MTVLHLELTAFLDRHGRQHLVLRERGEAKAYNGPLAVGQTMTELNARLHEALGTSSAPRGEGGRRAGKGPARRRLHQGSARPGENSESRGLEESPRIAGHHADLVVLDEPQSPAPQSFFDPGKFGPPGPVTPELDADVDGEAARDADGQHDQEGGGLEVEAGTAAEAGVGEDGGLDTGLASHTHHSRQPFVPHGSEDGRESTRGEGA